LPQPRAKPRLIARKPLARSSAIPSGHGSFFPGRIRYTSVSVPYHIGNGWGGGLVPFITTAAFQSTGSLGYALIYPIAVPAMCFVLALFLMPETRHISIWKPVEAKAAA
jgi:hypothetical protein